MNMSPITLPTHPSRLIRVALADLSAIEADDRYVVNMSDWHAPITDNYGRKVCSVCLAGAVMAKTVGVPHEQAISTADLDQYDRVEGRLRALDFFRLGEISAGLEMLGYDVNELSEEWQQYARKSGYSPADPDEFHDRMHRLADYLASCGL